MKKSFFLSAATLVAMFSFYACSGGEGGGVEPEPELSSSSTGTGPTGGSSSSGLTGGSSSSGLTGGSSSSELTGGSSSSESTGGSSSSELTGGSSSSELTGGSSSSGAIGEPETVQVACEIQMGAIFSMCMEILSGLSSSEIDEAKVSCAEEDEDGPSGTVVDNCPSGAALICPKEDEGGIKSKIYYYGDLAPDACDD